MLISIDIEIAQTRGAAATYDKKWEIDGGHRIIYDSISTNLETEETYQHPASGASSVGPTYYECVVYFLNDCDEIITFQLCEKESMNETKDRK